MRALVVVKHSWNGHKDIENRQHTFDARFSELIHALGNHTIEYEVLKVSECLVCTSLPDFDVIIVLGGDGTLLSTQYLIGETPVLAIRGDPGSRGFLLQHGSPAELVDAFVAGTLRTQKWTRVVHKEKDVLALNEFYFGHLYSMGNAQFRIAGQKYHASGIVISTGAGSTAWYAALGGERFNPSANELRYICREPQPGPGVSGVLTPGMELEIEVLTREHAILSADGVNPSYATHDRLSHLGYGQIVTLAIGTPLTILTKD